MMPPLGLQALATLTGIASGKATHLPAAYAAALTLADAPPSSKHDCNPTYVAISTLVRTIDPIADENENELELLFQHDMEHSDQLGSVIAAKTDASFLLGFCFAYVLVTSINHGGAK